MKNLPLDFEVTGTTASGYQYTGVECSIKSVSVLGLKNSLASVNKITIPSSVLSVAGATQDKVVTVNLNDYLPEDVSLANTDDDKCDHSFEGRTAYHQDHNSGRVGYFHGEWCRLLSLPSVSGADRSAASGIEGRSGTHSSRQT